MGNIASKDLIETATELRAIRRVPDNHFRDNCPEFVARELQAWLAKFGATTRYVEPAGPWQSDFAESFHSSLHHEFLAAEVIDN